MERYNPYSYNNDSSNQLLGNNAYGNRQLTSESNIDKRKLEEEIFNENKKRRDNAWTPSASTSKQYNEDVNYSESDRQRLSSNNCEKLSAKLSSNLQTFAKISNIPHRLLSLAYQIELSAMCLLRAHMFRNPSKAAIFKTTKIGQFNNIIQCFNGDYYCIRVQHVDTYYAKKCINHKTLFSLKETSLSSYLSEFAVELLCYLQNPSDAPKYLIFYTNCALDLQDGKLMDVHNPEEEGIQLEYLNSETDHDLLRLFKTGFDTDCEFYRFSNNRQNVKNLSALVKFTNDVKNRIGMDRLNEEGIKRKFFDRLVFAVKQPTIEELVRVVRTECRRGNENYSEFRREILEQLVIEEEYEDKEKKHAGNLLNKIYSFDVFSCCLHEMFMWENIVDIRFDESFNDNNIAINCRESSLCLTPLEVNFEKFDRNEFDKQIKFFNLRKHLKFFIRNFDPNLDYYVIFTNASLELVRDLILGEESNNLEFSRLDVCQERYSMFQHSFFNRNDIYQFALGETEKLLDFLTFPDNFDFRKFAHLNPTEAKRIFIDRIVFAVRQYNSHEMFKGLEEIVDMDSRVPYDFKGLQEIALRYLKSYDYGPMTKGVMIQVSDDLRSGTETVNVHIRYFAEEIKFAETAMELLDVSEFAEFVTFLTRGEGSVYLDTLKRNGIDIFQMANMIRSSQAKAKSVFLELYDLWFDKDGNKTRLLKLFEGQGFGVSNMSHMLRNAGRTCKFTLVNFFNLLFDDYGCPSIYLRSLQMEGVNLSQISSILSGSKEKSVKKFKDLYKFWFVPNGEKSECLKTLEKWGINLTIICNVISKPHNFPNLYNLWFHKSGRMTMFLQTLHNAGLSLTQICSVIKGPEGDPMVAFRLLFDLWFDKRGKKTFYLKTLQNERISLAIVLDILVETGCQVRKVFTKLFDQWFSVCGAKTQVLRNLEARGKTLAGICRLLSGAGCQAVEKFKALSFSLESVDSPIDRLLTNLACKEEAKTELITEYPEEFQKYQDYQNQDHREYQEAPLREVMRGNSKDFYQTYHNHQEASSSNEVIRGHQDASSSNFKTPPDEVIREQDFFQSIPEQSTSSSVYNPDYEPNDDYETYADFEEANPTCDDDGEAEELDIDQEDYMFKNKSHSKGQLKRKIHSFFRLFPTWKKSSRYRIKWNRVIKEVLPIINNPQALNSFLQSKLQKKKIDQGEFDELKTLSTHGPFNVGKLQHLLAGHTKSGKTNLTKKDKFANIIFPNEKSVEFKEVLDFLDRPQGKWYLQTMLGNKIFPQHVAKMLVGCKNVNEVISQMKELHELLFDKTGERTFCLKTLSAGKRNIRYIFVILGDSGNCASEAFKNLYNLWFDAKGRETRYLAAFKEARVTLIDMYLTFENSGSRSAESIQKFYNLCFDLNGRKTEHLMKLEAEGISLQLMMTILKGCGSKTSQVFQEFYHFLFDMRGYKTPGLQYFEENGITSIMIAKTLVRKGEQVCKSFEILQNFIFEGNSKRYYIRSLEQELSMEEIFGIISGYETDVNVFKELCDLWFDKGGNKSNYLHALEGNGVDLKSIANVLRGTGSTSYVLFNNIFFFLFDKKFHKSQQLMYLERVIRLRDFFEIVSGANKQVFEVIKSLYYLWFDSRGRKSAKLLYLEKNNLSLQELTPLLGYSGKNVVQKFKKILNLAMKRNFRKHDLLQHFKKKWDDNNDDDDDDLDGF